MVGRRKGKEKKGERKRRGERERKKGKKKYGKGYEKWEGKRKINNSLFQMFIYGGIVIYLNETSVLNCEYHNVYYLLLFTPMRFQRELKYQTFQIFPYRSKKVKRTIAKHLYVSIQEKIKHLYQL